MQGVPIHWFLAHAPLAAVCFAMLLVLRRRGEVSEYAKSHHERVDAKLRGSDKARLQHPEIDLSKCIGCGACVRACPEEGVLSLLHGQAVVVHGARCVGHGLCAAACPTAGIALTLGDLSERKDLPAIDEELEAVGVPGLFLAGELGGFALVRTAVSQGVAVADAVARRVKQVSPRSNGQASSLNNKPADVLIVGAGPGGLACSLRATEHGLSFVTIEQEERVGGTVATYPRRKLVMTQPMELPLHGRLKDLTYQKEDLVELWEGLTTKHALPIRTGVRLIDLNRDEDGVFHAETSDGVIRAKNVVLALGRRGTPRKLGVPGEDLTKVAYNLIDAESYQGRRVLVVGGGDSAIEAALGLAAQPGNEVTLSYRKLMFFRLKARNEKRIQKAIQEKRLRVIFESKVTRVEPYSVHLCIDGQADELTIPNDDVFVFAGGIPPFSLLEQAGVSFDPNDRPDEVKAVDRGNGLLSALIMVMICAGGMLLWALWHRAYYGLDTALRSTSELHPWLRPSGVVGLVFGVLAVVLFVWNLSYLIRRSPRWGKWLPGSLKLWMNTHVFTGLFAFLCVLIHAGFSLRDTVGGHAFIAFAIVVMTGVIGRYLYAFVPRATNGREVDLDDLRTQLTALSAQWDREGRGFGTKVRDQIDELLHKSRWRPGFLARIGVLLLGQIRLRRSLAHLRAVGRDEGIPESEIKFVLSMARRAYRLTLLVAHYEEIRAVLSSWRYFHRWLALLMVLLTIIHIVTAVRFAQIDWTFSLVGEGW